MKFLKYIITTAIALGVLSIGAFGFEQKGSQRPPKEPKVVREQPKENPPPRNENRGGGDRGNRGNNDNKRGRP